LTPPLFAMNTDRRPDLPTPPNEWLWR
jgi:hypothetical protein